MSTVATTRLNSHGEVAIPEEIRTRLGLATGQEFVVVVQGDTVILKSLASPVRNDFDDLAARARIQARKAGLKKADITAAIRKVRRSS